MIANSVFFLTSKSGMAYALYRRQRSLGKAGKVMPRKGEKARIAVLIVVAVLAIALAMLEALVDRGDTAAPGGPAQASEL